MSYLSSYSPLNYDFGYEKKKRYIKYFKIKK